MAINYSQDEFGYISEQEVDVNQLVDESVEVPLTFDVFSGQKMAKENMQLYIKAAQSRKEALDHVLLCGPNDMGKRTFANIIANEMGRTLRIIPRASTKNAADFYAFIASVNEGDVLFLDNVHQICTELKESFPTTLREYVVEMVLGKGATADVIQLDLPRFTVIAATNHYERLASSLRNSFEITIRFERYTVSDFIDYITHEAEKMELPIEPAAAQIIAAYCGDTPISAKNLLKRVRDYAQIIGEGIVDEALTKVAISRLFPGEIIQNIPHSNK